MGIILSRKLANLTHYPAIDFILRSRVMPILWTKALDMANKIGDMATYNESEDLINIVP